MEKLDDYIKTILDQSEPAYNNEYWKQTALYIENKRKKRFFFYLWFSVGILTLILGIGMLFMSNSDQSDIKSSSITKPIALETEKLNESNQITKESKLSSDKTPQQNTVLLPASSSSSSLIPKTKNQVKLNHNSISTNTSDPSTQDTKMSSSSLPANQSFLTEHNSDYMYSNDKTQSVSLNLLKLPFRIERVDNQELPEMELLEENDIVSEPLNSKLSYYVDLGGILNPVINPNQKWSLGMSGGFGINYDYKQKISLQAGISYLHRWGTFNVMIDHPTPIYDFTKDERGYTLVPTDAGYLTFPISLGIPVGKFTFGVGLNSMRLLGAKGKIFAYEGLPVENEPDKVVYRSTQISSGWIETPGFKKWVFEYNLFMERQMNTHLNVGMRFGYLPKGLVKSDYNFYYDNDSMNYIERESAGLLENNYHLTIYINYKL